MNHLHPKVTEIISPFPQGRIVLYLIRGERNAIIDTGTNITPEKDIAPILESMGLTLADIHLILNTHGHFDHTGGNHVIKNSGNAEIFIHKEDEAMVSEHERYFNEFFAPTAEKVLGKEYIKKEWEGFSQMAGPETGAGLSFAL